MFQTNIISTHEKHAPRRARRRPRGRTGERQNRNPKHARNGHPNLPHNRGGRRVHRSAPFKSTGRANRGKTQTIGKMKDVVSFETAKRLKEAGFPQPFIAPAQIWFIPQPHLVGLWLPCEENTSPYSPHGDWVFAPTATDILREFHRKRASVLLRLGAVEEGFECFYSHSVSGFLGSLSHDNPAEACAEAWLQLNEK